MLDSLLTIVTQFLASDSDAYIFTLALVGPTSAVLFFKKMHKKYRNFDQTHGFETETAIYGENMQASDVYATERRKTRDAHVQGRNSNTHRVRVQEF
jgi:hypothetical protein